MKFTETHEWITIDEEGVATVGISDHARKELGEIVFVELPQLGQMVKQNEEACVIESTKAASDIYAPASGEVIAVNDLSGENLSKLNTSSEKEGWLFKLRLTDPHRLHEKHLMSREQYDALLKS